MKQDEIILEDVSYKLIKNVNDGFDLESVQQRYTDYFKNYDFIVGDWSYGKLRLKGFNLESNPNYKKINDYKNVECYIENRCAYGCKWFILQKK